MSLHFLIIGCLYEAINDAKTLIWYWTADFGKKIISIIEEYVKPAVASDGGNILFESYKKEDKSVNVILQGACSGCPSSTFTLKNGIENMLKEMLPGKILKVNAVNG